MDAHEKDQSHTAGLEDGGRWPPCQGRGCHWDVGRAGFAPHSLQKGSSPVTSLPPAQL